MQTGDIVADRFVIERLAGSGGMGAVFRARDRATQSPVAVKVLQAHAGDDLARFLREARILSEIDDPRVVRYVAHGALPSGEPYLVMEWLDGEDLAMWLLRHRPSYEECLDLGIMVAEALATLHDRGIVHRDLKPSNIFLSEGKIEGVKLLDFGIARRESSTRRTATGTLLGTVSYMAPEQARGARDVDARADVFALGCVLFEMLTGRPPFAGIQAMSILTKILFEPTPRLSDRSPAMPPEVDALLARMLAKVPDERPRHGHSAAEELLRLRASSGQVDRPALTTAPPPAPRLSRGELRAVAVLLVGAPPLSQEEIDDAPLEQIAQSHGTRFERLLDFSATVVFSGATVATDLAAQAAECALAMRPHAKGRRIALSMGRSASGQLTVGAAFDRTVRLLADGGIPELLSDHATIVLDEPMAGLVDARFQVTRSNGVVVLSGEREVGAIRSIVEEGTPCLGRERELRSLEGLFHDCAEQSGAQVALVTAPPGVGKTRLGHEFVRLLRAREEDAEIWRARAKPLEQRTPGSLIAALLRDAERGEQLGARSAHTSSREIGLSEKTVSEAFLDVLTARARERPMILFLEEMHAADGTSIRVIDQALGLLEDLPLFVLALARPEIHDTFESLWKNRPVQEIRLRELPKRAAERLIQHVLGSRATPDMVERLMKLSEGNAYVLEELLRASLSREDSSLPESVVTLVHARLGDLDEDSRRILRAASLFGEVFPVEGVAALLGHLSGRSSGVRDRLDALVEHEILQKQRSSGGSGEMDYAFRSEIVREGAAAMLTDEDRELGRRLAAEWIAAHEDKQG